MDTFVKILVSIPWFAWVAIIAILCGTIQAIIKMGNTHEERMAMIKAGMDPSNPRNLD